MGLFPTLLNAGEGGITALELAEKTKSDEILVTRIMRVVTATGYAKELGVGHYTTTPKTGFFAPGSPFIDVIVHMFVSIHGSLSQRKRLRLTAGHHTPKPSLNSLNTSA
jgi:hypothetical protein